MSFKSFIKELKIDPVYLLDKMEDKPTSLIEKTKNKMFLGVQFMVDVILIGSLYISDFIRKKK